MEKKSKKALFSYFQKEKKFLVLTAVTGIIYNIGMTAGPLFEGQMAQELYDILKGERKASDLVMLSAVYVLVIFAVQAARALKRLYVRKFANRVSASMKRSIYHHLLKENSHEIEKEDVGAVMTKAIADAEACAEGMRKFTTEIFDTGVVMIAYLVTLFLLDYRLTLLVLPFPPIAYAISAALKKKVVSSAAESRDAMAKVNSAAVDSCENALTYWIYGQNENREKSYEDVLSQYERKNVKAGIYQNAPQPVYLVISLLGVIPILYFGGANVMGNGWQQWTIASFSSFLVCFNKLATKSSHAAKLFNAVQKAEVSWSRIENYLDDSKEFPAAIYAAPGRLEMRNVCFAYPDQAFSLNDLNLCAEPGEIIGICGNVASGKSTFGKLFLNEDPYQGTILFGGKDIKSMQESAFAYAGHDPQLFEGTVRENVTFLNADEERLKQVLKEVQIDKEVGPDTMIKMEGSGISGGQQSRIALARALYSKAPVLILDDPFAAVDADCERRIFQSLRTYESNRIILLISHRLAMFPEMDQIIYLENGSMKCAGHSQMMHNPGYAALYELQKKEGEMHA